MFNGDIDFYRIVLLVVLTLLALWFGLDTAKEPRRFISVAGMLVYVGISWALSKHRRKVSYGVFVLSAFWERKKSELVLRILSMLLSHGHDWQIKTEIGDKL